MLTLLLLHLQSIQCLETSPENVKNKQTTKQTSEDATNFRHNILLALTRGHFHEEMALELATEEGKLLKFCFCLFLKEIAQEHTHQSVQRAGG